MKINAKPDDHQSEAISTPVTIAELITAMESMFPIGAPTTICWAVTGEPYISFCMGGVRAEGADHEILGKNETVMVKCFWLHFLEYARGRDGVLYWRWKPTISESDSYGLSKISARFLISNKPPLSVS